MNSGRIEAAEDWVDRGGGEDGIYRARSRHYTNVDQQRNKSTQWHVELIYRWIATSRNSAVKPVSFMIFYF